jgi:hypothetical protein
MSSHARFLILREDGSRALLFDAAQRLIGEVIEDDGYIVGHLLRMSRACPVPHAGMLAAIVPPPSHPVRCYDLG